MPFSPLAQSKPWMQPEITGINVLPPRATSYSFPSMEGAHEPRENSPWFLDLNGSWDFSLRSKPEDVQPEDVLSDAKRMDARPITVPANWTMEGVGDDPWYTNVQMPFTCKPPHVPEENPTGIYHRSFSVDSSWMNRRTVLHFDGVESCFFVFVNGQEVGFSKDSRTPSAFDITGFLNNGENQLTVVVLRWSDGSFLEDQDHWWMAGIYRDVYLYSTGERRIRDAWCTPTLCDVQPQEGHGDAGFEERRQLKFSPFHDQSQESGPAAVPANLAVDILVDGEESLEDYSFALSLEDAQGHLLLQKHQVGSTRFRTVRHTDPDRGGQDHVRLSFPLEGVQSWSSEHPILYRLRLALLNPQGEVVEALSHRIGFRSVTIAQRELRINEKPVLIKGVNRHEHDPKTGKTVDRQSMIADILLLKQHNFNAVRTAHYPNTPEWYDLCDEYGIYLVDEANIECHDYYDQLCRDPRWTAAFVDRVRRMVIRDRNHPSIILWSMGNESGYGPNHDAAIAFTRRTDPTRPIHYEGAVRPEWGQGLTVHQDHWNRQGTDVVCPMYESVDDMIHYATQVADDRPYIACEYSHAMGNSNGNLKEYWDAFHRVHGLQGGFIWDWVDQGLEKTAPNGKTYWAYGGDYDEPVHDFDFCINGLIWPNRTPHPAMEECKYLTQPLAFSLQAAPTPGSAPYLTITNRQDFSGTAWLEASWELLIDGTPQASGPLSLPPIPVGQEAKVPLPCALPALAQGKEAHLNLTVRVREATAWCPAGHIIASEQLPIAGSYTPLLRTTPHGGDSADSPAFVEETWQELSPQGSTRRFALGKEELHIAPDGSLSWLGDSQPVALSGPEPHFWRAATDNDGIREWSGQEGKPLGQWMAAGLNRLVIQKYMVEIQGSQLILKTVHAASDGPEGMEIRVTRSFTALKGGGLGVDGEFFLPQQLPSLPRVGLLLQLPQDYQQLRWYGRGPHENYSDRNASAFLGCWESTVNNQFVPYILPQECGNKTDVRWASLQSSEGSLRVLMDRVFQFSALPHSPTELFEARHTSDLQDDGETWLSLDVAHRGLGTGSCGPQTREEYEVSPGHYTWRLALIRE
ncbi:MAG: DUF4981 domain-containing protein [Spirochaetales bacterium]|nr:DUF4981 domain-containing protein [Spirochaetales bacterium]